MHISRKFFCLSLKGIFLLQNCFSSYLYLKDIYKTLRETGNIQFVSELAILLNLYISKFHWSLQIKELKLAKLEYYSVCGAVNFSVMHPTHITIYKF